MPRIYASCLKYVHRDVGQSGLLSRVFLDDLTLFSTGPGRKSGRVRGLSHTLLAGALIELNSGIVLDVGLQKEINSVDRDWLLVAGVTIGR